MQPVTDSIRSSTIASTRLAVEERWLLVCVATFGLVLFAAIYIAARQHDFALLRTPARIAAVAQPSPAWFDVDAELRHIDTAAPVAPVDLAANADVGAGDRFALAMGPPLNLLAQVVDRRAATALPLPVAEPKAPLALLAQALTLSADEQLIVDANAERRDVRRALDDVRARAAATGVAVAIAVEPLLLRASVTTETLDAFGDALLLSDSVAEQQIAYFGFQASRAAALGDIERAAAILG
jgi:hypothetical protein